MRLVLTVVTFVLAICKFTASQAPPESELKSSGVQPKIHKDLWTDIPLEELVKFGKETSISTLLAKHLSNAKVGQDNDSAEILVDDDGHPLLSSKKERIVVAPVSQTDKSKKGNKRGRTNIPIGNGEDGPDRAGGSREAICSPEKVRVTVSLNVPPDMIILPRCAVVSRCGGCCNDIMSCEPVETETAVFSIMKFGYIRKENTANNKTLEFADVEKVKLEQHTKCKCRCKEKPKDCSNLQFYDERVCSCQCKSTAGYAQCQQDANKVWDSDHCMCVCRELRECNSGHYFDNNSCECELQIF